MDIVRIYVDPDSARIIDSYLCIEDLIVFGVTITVDHFRYTLSPQEVFIKRLITRMPALHKHELTVFTKLMLTTQHYLLLYTPVFPELIKMHIDADVIPALVQSNELTYIRGSVGYTILKYVQKDTPLLHLIAQHAITDDMLYYLKRMMSDKELLTSHVEITLPCIFRWAPWFLNYKRVKFLEAMMSRYCEHEDVGIAYKQYLATRFHPRKRDILSAAIQHCPDFIEICLDYGLVNPDINYLSEAIRWHVPTDVFIKLHHVVPIYYDSVMTAVRYNRADYITLLLSQWLNFEHMVRSPEDSLFTALEYGHMEAFTALIQYYTNFDVYTYEEGRLKPFAKGLRSQTFYNAILARESELSSRAKMALKLNRTN